MLIFSRLYTKNREAVIMKSLRRLNALPLFITLAHFVFVECAYGYLDPGTGSYFFQILLAMLLGGLFAVRLLWKRIKAAFINLFSSIKKAKKDGNLQ